MSHNVIDSRNESGMSQSVSVFAAQVSLRRWRKLICAIPLRRTERKASFVAPCAGLGFHTRHIEKIGQEIELRRRGDSHELGGHLRDIFRRIF
jgi:hypothetical protein